MALKAPSLYVPSLRESAGGGQEHEALDRSGLASGSANAMVGTFTSATPAAQVQDPELQTGKGGNDVVHHSKSRASSKACERCCLRTARGIGSLGRPIPLVRLRVTFVGGKVASQRGVVALVAFPVALIGGLITLIRILIAPLRGIVALSTLPTATSAAPLFRFSLNPSFPSRVHFDKGTLTLRSDRATLSLCRDRGQRPASTVSATTTSGTRSEIRCASCRALVRDLVIGADRAVRLLEIVVLDDDPQEEPVQPMPCRYGRSSTAT